MIVMWAILILMLVVPLILLLGHLLAVEEDAVATKLMHEHDAKHPAYHEVYPTPESTPMPCEPYVRIHV